MITQKLVISSLLKFSIITAKVPTEFEAASLAKHMVAKNGVGQRLIKRAIARVDCFTLAYFA